MHHACIATFRAHAATADAHAQVQFVSIDLAIHALDLTLPPGSERQLAPGDDARKLEADARPPFKVPV